jgi:hypothetical protein
MYTSRLWRRCFVLVRREDLAYRAVVGVVILVLLPVSLFLFLIS